MRFCQIASGVGYNLMPCANAGSKPGDRCGYTDDIPCRLRNAGSMTFLPLFVPRTEQQVKLREEGQDRGHLLTESCGDVHLNVCRCRTGGEDCFCCCTSMGSPVQHITVLLTLSLLFSHERSIAGVAAACTRCCSSRCCCCCCCCCCGRCSSTRTWWSTVGTEAIRPSRWRSRIV